jgi:hypothetical protein
MASGSRDEKKDKGKGREVIASGNEVRCNLLGNEDHGTNRAISAARIER